MRHLIAEGIKRGQMIKTLSGYVPRQQNVRHHVVRQHIRPKTAHIGYGVAHRRLSHSELVSRELDGGAIKHVTKHMNKLHMGAKKHIKPLKFRI